MNQKKEENTEGEIPRKDIEILRDKKRQTHSERERETNRKGYLQVDKQVTIIQAQRRGKTFLKQRTDMTKTSRTDTTTTSSFGKVDDYWKV